MRLMYLGLPLGALCLRRAGIEPVVCCIGHPRAPGMRRLRARAVPRSGAGSAEPSDGEWGPSESHSMGRGGAAPSEPRALLLGRPDLDDHAVFHAIRSARVDALASWFWPRKIPTHVLDLAPDRAFGVHPSLLPRWRGPDPYFWAIASGDRETGVTVHRLAPEYDTGEILASEVAAIEPHTTGGALAHALDRRSLHHLVATARKLARGEALSGAPQRGDASWAPEPSEDDLVLHFERPARELERLVRAARPSCYASALLEHTYVDVLSAELAEASRALEIGEARADERGVVVRAGDGGLRLTAVRTDEGRVLRGEAIAVLLQTS